jgi:peptidoglycan/LPS O-acetylase OafA/YrhL
MHVTSSHSLVAVQILRAVAAGAVLFAHLNTEIAGRLEHVRFVGVEVGQFGVDLFFVISGFIIVHSSEDLFGRERAGLRFFGRRLMRIVPLYWIITAILLLHVVRHYATIADANMSLGYIVASVLFIPYPTLSGEIAPTVGVGWTLNYEMFFYAVFAVVVGLPRVAAVLLCGSALIFGVWVNSSLQLPLPIEYWLRPLILEFVFGMGIALLCRSGICLPALIRAILVLGAFATISATIYVDFAPRIIEWGLPCAVLVAGATLGPDIDSRNLIVSAAGILGDASYSLYLTHSFAFTLPRQLLGSQFAGSIEPHLYAAALITVSCVVAICVYFVVERPLTRMMRIFVRSRATLSVSPSM